MVASCRCFLDREAAMMRILLITIFLMSGIWSVSFAEDVIITTNGDVTAGLSRDHSRATGFASTIDYPWGACVLIGEDSTSSTAHKLFLWYTGSDGEYWAQRPTRPFTTPSGFASSVTDPIMSWFGGDTVWLCAPDPYSGSNMQVRSSISTVINSLDTITPAASAMITGLMRWKNGGDTLIYAMSVYDPNLDDQTFAVVKSSAAWSQTVTFTPIDTFNVATLSDFNSDYCGTGVALWDRQGLDLYWIDGTVNDAIKTLGTNKVPALLSTTKKNATTMCVVNDSTIIIAGYLARDTSIWQYRWYATGGSRKTGLTLRDSTQLVSKSFLVGSAVDSLAPMPCYSTTTAGDTVVFYSRIWRNLSNLDSICVNYKSSMASGSGYGSLTGLPPLTFGEGLRYRNLCAPRYIGKNAVVFWQKGVSTPDTIYASIADKFLVDEESPIQQLAQNDTTFSSKFTFQGTTEVEDMYGDTTTASMGFNYGSNTILKMENIVSTGSKGQFAPLIRPVFTAKASLQNVLPCKIVYCSLEVWTETAPGVSKTIAIQAVAKNPKEGTLNGSDPGATDGSTQLHWNANGDLASRKWRVPGGGVQGATVYSADSASPDVFTTFLHTSTFASWNADAAGTRKAKALNTAISLDHFNRALRGETNNGGWIKATLNSAAATVPSLRSSEHATSTNGPKFYFNCIFNEPGYRRKGGQNFLKSNRKTQKTPGFRKWAY